MTTTSAGDENAYIQELNRLFLSCAQSGGTYLDSSGLRELCSKLNLCDFRDVVVDRILCGFPAVDFLVFKERFINLLPEIINVSENNENFECLAKEKLCGGQGAEFCCDFVRFDNHLMNQNTSNFNNSINEIDANATFDHGNTEGVRRVTFDHLRTNYKLQTDLRKEVNFITESFVPCVNFFETIDPLNTGVVSCQKLLEHWLACGVTLDQGIYVLKKIGQPSEGTINAIVLSGSLERELGDLAAAPNVSIVVRIALLSLHAFIDHLRCSLNEAELRAEHSHKQLQLANQRHSLLIEELEQNQLSIEEVYEQRFRESEERNRLKLAEIENNFKQEKKEILTELEKTEEKLSILRQSEVTCRTRLQVVDRQVSHYCDEVRRLSKSVQHLEQINRQLRTDLAKAKQSQSVQDDSSILMLRRRVELLLAHNKRLREKNDILTKYERKNPYRKCVPLYAHWTSDFYFQLLALRKRRDVRPNDTLSEFESEPESIFVRSKRRRLLNFKERKRRHDRIVGTIHLSSTSENGSLDKGSSFLDGAQNKITRQNYNMDDKMRHIREHHRKEMLALKHSASKALADALSDQQRQIKQSFEKERRQFQTKLVTERNALERKFADDKMKLMIRLQEEFEWELNRSKSEVFPSRSDMREGVEEKLMSRVFKKPVMYTSKPKTAISKSCDTSKFSRLLEKFCFDKYSYEKKEKSTFLGIEKNTFSSSPKIASESRWKSRKCSNCESVRTRLKQVHAALISQNFDATKSGLDSLISISAGDNVAEEQAKLRSEIKILNSRLNMAREKVTKLHSILGAQKSETGTVKCCDQCCESCDREIVIPINISSERESFVESTFLSHECHLNEVEKLKADNVLLNARLNEFTLLMKIIFKEYTDQLDKTIDFN